MENSKRPRPKIEEQLPHVRSLPLSETANDRKVKPQKSPWTSTSKDLLVPFVADAGSIVNRDWTTDSRIVLILFLYCTLLPLASKTIGVTWMFSSYKLAIADCIVLFILSLSYQMFSLAYEMKSIDKKRSSLHIGIQLIQNVESRTIYVSGVLHTVAF